MHVLVVWPVILLCLVGADMLTAFAKTWSQLKQPQPMEISIGYSDIPAPSLDFGLLISYLNEKNTDQLNRQ